MENYRNCGTKGVNNHHINSLLSSVNTYYESRPYLSNHKYKMEDKIRDEVCATINKFRNGGSINKHEKHYVKYLLCWINDRNYYEMLNTSKRIMNILSRPLIIEYKKLQNKSAKILLLSLNKKKDGLPQNIISNHGLLEWNYNKWYKKRKALFWPNDLKPLADEWNKIGMKMIDPTFSKIRRNGLVDKDKSFTSADELAMDYLNLIAHTLDPSFQLKMKQLFAENRKKMGKTYPITNNKDLGVLSGPVKTKARQIIKVTVDYKDKPAPQCMAVLDIVRCAIVCEDDAELCNLFEIIINTFSGKILRVKNAFDNINKGTYGYRAVLINLAYGDTKLLPKGYEMIVECQLLLNQYYQVRKNMHLGYGICRSEEGTKPQYILAQDSSKFGKLDI